MLTLAASCMAGCGGSESASEEPAAEATEEIEETEEVKEAEAEEDDEPKPEIIDLGNAVLIDNDEMKIIAKDLEVYSGEFGGSKYNAKLNVAVENKSDQDRIILDSAWLNNNESWASWRFDKSHAGTELEIASGEIIDAKMDIADSEIRAQGGKLTDIVIVFLSAKDFETKYESEHIYPYGEENATGIEHVVGETEVVIADNESVFVSLKETYRMDEETICISYYVENRTDGEIYFICNDEVIDGTPVRGIIYFGDETIPAGKSVDESIFLYRTDVEGSGLDFDKLGEIEYTLWVFDADNFTEDTFDAITFDWHNMGDDSEFNPEQYMLVKESTSCILQ